MFTVAFTVRVRSRWRSLQLAMGYSLQLLHHMLHYHTKWTCSSPTTILCGREVATLVWLIKQLRVALHFSHAHEAAILMSSQTTRGVLKSFLDWWTCWDKLKLTQHFTSNCSNPMCHSPFPNLILRSMFYPRKEVLVVDTFLLEISGTTLSYRRWDHELFTPTSLANT